MLTTDAHRQRVPQVTHVRAPHTRPTHRPTPAGRGVRALWTATTPPMAAVATPAATTTMTMMTTTMMTGAGAVKEGWEGGLQGAGVRDGRLS